MSYDIDTDPPPSRVACAAVAIFGLAWICFCLYWLARLGWALILWLNNHV